MGLQPHIGIAFNKRSKWRLKRPELFSCFSSEFSNRPVLSILNNV